MNDNIKSDYNSSKLVRVSDGVLGPLFIYGPREELTNLAHVVNIGCSVTLVSAKDQHTTIDTIVKANLNDGFVGTITDFGTHYEDSFDDMEIGQTISFDESHIKFFSNKW